MSDEIEKLKHAIKLIDRLIASSLLTAAENILIKRDIQKLIDSNTPQLGAYWMPMNEKVKENVDRLSDDEIAEMWGDECSGKLNMINNFARKIEEETLRKCGVTCNTIY